MPKWMATLDTFSAGKMLGLGLLLSALNPKNLALTVSAATTIAQAGVSGGQEAWALAVFVLIGSLTIIAPVVIYFTMGTKAKPILDELNGFMAAHNGAIMTVLFLVLGAKLIGEAIAGFSSEQSLPTACCRRRRPRPTTASCARRAARGARRGATARPA